MWWIMWCWDSGILERMHGRKGMAWFRETGAVASKPSVGLFFRVNMTIRGLMDNLKQELGWNSCAVYVDYFRHWIATFQPADWLDFWYGHVWCGLRHDGFVGSISGKIPTRLINLEKELCWRKCDTMYQLFNTCDYRNSASTLTPF